MRRVVIASPWRGAKTLHQRYLEACLRDAYGRGEAPVASHAIGPLVLREEVVEDRERGLRAGLAWIDVADALVMYVDLGISEGMARERRRALNACIPVEERSLGRHWAAMGEPPRHAGEISDREVCRAVIDGNGSDRDGRTVLSYRTRAPLAMCHEAVARTVDARLVRWEEWTIRWTIRRLLDEEMACG